jgi:hypothetical protein
MAWVFNRPDIVSVDSFNDPNVRQTSVSQSFTNPQNTPIIGASEIQLKRCSFTAATLQIPDYQLIFWYYRLATATTAPAAASLKAVRLFPSTYQAPSGLNYTPTLNRPISGGADFVALLNTATTNDDATRNPYWTTGDITFTWNSTNQRITFVGNTDSNFYTPAGHSDPIVQAAFAAAPITMANTNNSSAFTNQPFVFGYPLNLRVGFAMSGFSAGSQSFNAGNYLYASKTNTAVAEDVVITADSYPCLIYTQNVYVYSTLSGSAGNDSTTRKDLLAVVPVDVPSFSLVSYNNPFPASYLRKPPTEIYAIDITLFDDAGQPYNLYDSQNFNVELSIKYNDNDINSAMFRM